MKLGNTESTFINLFKSPTKTYAISNITLKAISQIPRFIIEAIAFGGLITVIIFNLTVYGIYPQRITHNNALCTKRV